MDKQSKEMQELDADMAKIMKYEVGMREQCKGIWVRVNELNEISDWFDWHPTTNIAQAFECLNTFECWTLEKIGISFVFHVFMSHKWIVETAETKELAICLAAKKA